MLPARAALRMAIDLGFEAFEILGEFPQWVCDEEDERTKKEMKSLGADAGVALAVHAPFTSLNIAAFNPGIRKESVRQCLAAVDFCADIGGETVIVHNGAYVTSERVRSRFPEAARVQWDLNIKSLHEIATRGEERGVIVCLENIGFQPNCMDPTTDDMLRIKEQVGSSALAFCIDIGHARLSGKLDVVIEKMGPHARHIHLADNLGEKDDHAVIGEGNFDYTPYREFFRGFEHVIILEVHNIGTDPELAVKSREYVRDFLRLDGRGGSHAG
jgi:sugar phosphate isomerase/epimerase